MVDQYKSQRQNLKKALGEFESGAEEFKRVLDLGKHSNAT